MRIPTNLPGLVLGLVVFVTGTRTAVTLVTDWVVQAYGTPYQPPSRFDPYQPVGKRWHP